MCLVIGIKTYHNQDFTYTLASAGHWSWRTPLNPCPLPHKDSSTYLPYTRQAHEKNPFGYAEVCYRYYLRLHACPAQVLFGMSSPQILPNAQFTMAASCGAFPADLFSPSAFFASLRQIIHHAYLEDSVDDLAHHPRQENNKKAFLMLRSFG